MNPNCIICNSQCAFLIKTGKEKGGLLHYCKNCFHIQTNCESSADNNDICFTRDPNTFIQKFKASNLPQLIIKQPIDSFVTEFEYNLSHILRKGQVSFFCTNSLKLLCDKNGVFLKRVNIDDNNCSYLIDKKYNSANSIIEQLLHEIEKKLYSESTYFTYTAKYIIFKNAIQNYILLQKIVDNI